MVAPASVIVEATFQGASGLARDRFVNLFHFASHGSNDPVGAVANGALGQVCGFFTRPMAEAFANLQNQPSLAQCMAGNILRTVQLKAYDLAAGPFPTSTPPENPNAPEPPKRPRGALRPVLCSATFEMGNPVSGQASLPDQIALCLSYYTDVNKPSHRGRIYIGPLGVVASAGSHPLPAFVAGLAMQGGRLVGGVDQAAGLAALQNHTGDATPAVQAAWCLLSRKLQTVVQINHVWVDDEWDGQRRRRIKATTRVTI